MSGRDGSSVGILYALTCIAVMSYGVLTTFSAAGNYVARKVFNAETEVSRLEIRLPFCEKKVYESDLAMAGAGLAYGALGSGMGAIAYLERKKSIKKLEERHERLQ